MRQTKIVCTIGPASDDPKILRAMMEAGMDVARLNFSHAGPAEHAERISRIRSVAQSLSRDIAILGDLSGPKLRTGSLGRDTVVLNPDEPFVLTTEPVVGDWQMVSVTFPELANIVKPGQTILLNDGAIELVVESLDGPRVHTRIKVGGILGPHKGVNIPGCSLGIDAFTAKDHRDLAFALEQRLDWIALSFVRYAKDIRMVKTEMDRLGSRIPIMAKIEQREAVFEIVAIAKEAEGLMVARGDLGVETALEDVPFIQKDVIAVGLQCGIPVVTATHMLESMVNSPRPTRAEATDVATAVLDGSDALMLSEESATGRYPVEAVRTMARIAERAESAIDSTRFLRRAADDYDEAVYRAACSLAAETEARAIVVLVEDGTEPTRIAAHRSPQTIIAVTDNATIAPRLAVTWGVLPVVVTSTKRSDWFTLGVERARTLGYLDHGDRYLGVTPPSRDKRGAIEVFYS